MDFLKQISQLPALKAMKNELCKNHTIKTIDHILQGSTWALKMLDSSTKVPEGVVAGTLTHMGNFEECLEVNVREEWGSFKGQHCLVDANVYIPEYMNEGNSVPFTWAVCLPSSCAAADLTDFLTTAFHYPVNVKPFGCHIQEPRPFLPLDWLAIGILSFFGLLCLLSTTYDLIVSDPRSRREILLVFSWYTNGKQLLKTKRSPSMLECLHGIRFLSIAWILLGHVYGTGFILPAANMLYLPQYVKRWEHCLMGGAILAVDTFLTLSGALLCYIFMGTMSKGRNFNLITYFLHRYMRTTPLVATLIMVYVSLILHLGSGPIWDAFVQEGLTTYCKKNWWAAVLHIQNYVIPSSEMCLIETWYLSVDMQLYLFSPLLLLPLLKRPKFGLILLEVVTTISVISCFFGTYLDPHLKHVSPPQHYVYTHNRATPWFVGINLGYCLFHTTQWRKDVAKTRSGLSKKVLAAGWLLAGVCLAAPVLVQQQLIRDLDWTVFMDYNNLEWTIFMTLARLIWPLGISWVIFVCVSGYGGPVNAFLSWKFFTPLSRLTYSIYILHMLSIRVYFFPAKTVIHNDDREKVTLALALLVYTTLLAIPASLTFEIPVTRLQNFLLGYQKEQKNHIQPEINHASYQEEKIHNDPFPGAVMTPGSSFSKELNTVPKNSTSGGRSVHTAMQIN